MAEADGESHVKEQIAGVIVAGGQSRRWGGGDKFLTMIGSRTLLQRVSDRMSSQVRLLILNANGARGRFQDLGMAVVPDVVGGSLGPLAGVLTGLDWVRENLPGVPWVLSVPADAPFLPDNLAARLMEAIDSAGADMGCARSGGRTHPIVGLWPVALCDQLCHDLVTDEVRKIDAWTAAYHVAYADWPTDPIDPFFNINTRDDLDVAQALDRQNEN